ncbi:MAG: hypothetical protein J0I13_16315, partial [Rhizobiales bacterium]|nr:hypothetical protein [Hyphomicrobiales bacterium]
SHAATLYGLVKRHGSGNTRIAVTGDSGSRMAARATMRRRARQVVEDDEDVVTRRAPVYRASSEYRAYRAPRYWDEDAYGVRWYYQGGYPRY